MSNTMNGRRAIGAAVSALALAFAATACTGQEAAPSSTSAGQRTVATIAADWVTYDSIPDLAAAAELVAVIEVGPVLRRFPVLQADGSEAFRRVVHTGLVQEVILGDASLASSMIQITYIDFGTPTEGITPYVEGERLVMFLAPTGPTAEGTWAPISSDEGVFDFTTGEQVLMSRGQELSDRQFTLEDLRRLVGATAGG